MNPLFSICIPVRNSIETLPRCLESIKDQNFDNYEIVIIDNGSEEKTRRFLEEIEDKRVTVFFQENRGLYLSRKKAIELSNGEYLLFLDSDDYLEEGILSGLSAVISLTNADVLLLSTNVIESNLTKEVVYPFENTELIEYDKNMAKDFLADPLFSNIWNKVIRKGIIHGKYDFNFTNSEGLFYVLELLESDFSFVNCRSLHYNYLVNKDSSIRKYNECFAKDLGLLLDEYLKFVEKIEQYELIEHKASSFYFLLFNNVCAIAKNFNSKDSYNKMKELRDSYGVQKLFSYFKIKNLSFRRHVIIVLFKLRLFKLIQFICKTK